MLRKRRAAGIPDHADLTPDQAYALLCGGELVAVPADDAEANAEAEAAARAKATAEAILAAGARARSTGENERPPPTGRAKQILDAAKKAHRRIGDD